jgi:hypothetical protein
VLFVLPARTTQNAIPAPLVSRPPRFRRFTLSSRGNPRLFAGDSIGGFMVCYQVSVQFAFIRHKTVLVSTHIKKQKAKAFLIFSGLPFGSGLKYRRFFKTKKEAFGYVSHLHAVYKNRIVPNPPLPGGQLYLF